METDYESFPTQPRKRQTSTYGKKGKIRSNLSTRLLSNPNLLSSASLQQQENRESSTSRRALKRATSEVQLGKRRRSKQEEGSQSDGDASMESNDEEPAKGVQLPHSKRPRASSHDTTIFAVSQSSMVPTASSTTNPHSITSKSSYLELGNPSNPSITSKSQITSNSKLTPLEKSSSKLSRRTKSRSIDDGRGTENPIKSIVSRIKSKEMERDAEVEKEKDLEIMMEYVMMDDEVAPTTSTSAITTSQQLSRPRAALLASVNFPPSSPTASVLGDKSNLPRSAQDGPISTTSNQQFLTSRGITSGLNAGERKNSKSSNLKIVPPSPKPSLKVYKDESTTPRASSFHNRLPLLNVRRATSLNTESGQALNLDSLSNALLLESGSLEVPSHFALRSNMSDKTVPNITRYSSVPLPTSSSKLLSQSTNQLKDHSAIPFTVDETARLHLEPREGSLIPIDVIGMDSSMILESFDPDDNENEEDQEVGIDLVFSGGDLILKADVEKVEKGNKIDEVVRGLEIRKEENFPLLGNEVEKDDRDEMDIEIDDNSVTNSASKEETLMTEEKLTETVRSEDAKDETPSIDVHESQTIPTIISPSTDQSIEASNSVTFQEPQISPRLPTKDLSDDDSRSYYTSSETEEFSFTLPPRTFSKPIDPPTTTGRPLIDEDYLAYFIRTTSTGENEFQDEEDEFEEIEIGEGSKPGSRIDGDGVGSRGRERARKEREKVEAKRLKNQILINPLEGGETDDELMIRIDEH